MGCKGNLRDCENDCKNILLLADGDIKDLGVLLLLLRGGKKRLNQFILTRPEYGSGRVELCYQINRTFWVGSILKETRPNYNPNHG